MATNRPRSGLRAWVSLIIAIMFIIAVVAAIMFIPSSINTGHTEIAPIPTIISTPPPAPTATPTRSPTSLLMPDIGQGISTTRRW